MKKEPSALTSTPPTDYKKLAEDTLAGYVEMNAVALMGALSISYSHDEAVSIVASYIRTPKLARAVLALDAEVVRLQCDENAWNKWGNIPNDILRGKLATLDAELTAYKRAKAENDERYMVERDQARAENQRLREALEEAPCDCPYGNIPGYEHKHNCFTRIAREALERK